MNNDRGKFILAGAVLTAAVIFVLYKILDAVRQARAAAPIDNAGLAAAIAAVLPAPTSAIAPGVQSITVQSGQAEAWQFAVFNLDSTTQNTDTIIATTGAGKRVRALFFEFWNGDVGQTVELRQTSGAGGSSTVIRQFANLPAQAGYKLDPTTEDKPYYETTPGQSMAIWHDGAGRISGCMGYRLL